MGGARRPEGGLHASDVPQDRLAAARAEELTPGGSPLFCWSGRDAMDIQKQIDYWKKGSEEDIAAAEVLLEKGHYRHALFFAHLSVEKAIKAHVSRQTREIPPKIHNLTRLAEKAKLTLDTAQREFLLAFDEYQVEGRYPDTVSAPIGEKEAREQVAKAKEAGQWLISLL